MGEIIRKQSVSPIMLDGKAAGSEALLQNIHTFMKKSLSKQASTERTMKQNTKQLAEVAVSVEEVKQQCKEAIKSHVAKRIIREQLQQERHEKAHQLAKENVQLTTDDVFKVEKMVEQVGESKRGEVEVIVAELATKRETTQIMYQITSYIKKQLKLRSIEDIPNDFVDQHKVLIQKLTRKKLDTFMKKGSR